MHLVPHVIMVHLLPSLTPAPPNPSLDLNLNMNLNPETTVHDDMYNVKYYNPGDLCEPVLFEPTRQISHAMFKITSFVHLDHNLSHLSH